MVHAARPSHVPPPHPDLSRARDCERCLGWGTVVTRDGEHELCPGCQRDPGAARGPLR
ncbi:hypothetical protein ACF09H_16225 [Streptomyces sp. NPDC014983]|uniref:hypothetical protein n=1 Tax=Streptomyces sp. NPDC014983 TaxID=3364933 RepID=UPI0036FD1F8C